MVKKLQRENDELRKFIKNQQQRIEELSNRTSNLTNQIEKTHKIQSTITTNYCHKRNMKKKRNDNSNRKPYTDQNISSTTTTDNSRTVDNQTEDDTIKIARLRLNFLEKNTEEVEQNLNFQKENFVMNCNCYDFITCDKGMIISNKSLHNDIPKNNINLKTIHYSINATDNSPSDVHSNMQRNSYVDSIDSPINKGNCELMRKHAKLLMSISDISD